MVSDQSETREGAPELLPALSAMAAVVLGEDTVTAVLDMIVGLACSTIPAVDEASVTTVRTRTVDTASASSPEVRDADQAQYDADDGPCLEALRTGERHAWRERDGRTRWPTFADAAAEAGMRATLAVPLIANESTVGALNLYSRSDVSFDDVDDRILELFVAHASTMVANVIAFATSEATNEHLMKALDTRQQIGQAVGILMAREHCGPDDAFDILRRASQRTNRRLRDLAQDLVEQGQERPTSEA